MGEWREVKLNDYLEATSSKRIFAKEYVERGIPFYRSKEIIEKEYGKEINNPLYISTERFNEIKNKFGAPVNGDILMSAVGERSGVPYVVSNDGDFYFKDGNLIWLKGFKKNLSSDFLYRWFKSKDGQHTLSNSMIGSAQRALTIQGIKNLVIQIPPLKEQKAIAEVLSSLDDKIDLLHRQNKTLEALAQTLFRQWFIEEAKDDWEVGFFSDLVDVSSGKSLKRVFFDDNGKYKVLGANGEIGKTNEWLFDEKLIFTGRVGTLGNVFINDVKAWLSDNTLVVKPKEYFYYIYFLLKSFKLENYNVGSTQPLIRQSDLKNIEISIPSKDIILLFEKQSDDIFGKINKNKNQIKTIENMRDTLLPKLLGGEVKVNY